VQRQRLRAVAGAAAVKAPQAQAAAAGVRPPAERMVLRVLLEQLEQAEQAFHSRFLATTEVIRNPTASVEMVE